jgi:uncharacterized protein YggE
MKAGILVGTLFLALLAAIIIVIDLVRIPDMYEVQGTAEIKYAPDTARIDVGVVAWADVSNDAAQQVAAKMTSVINALKTAGVSDADLSSQGISSDPTPRDYSPQPGGKGVPAYTATQSVAVVVHDLDRTGALLTAISGAGANSWHVDYYTADQSHVEAAAQQAAFQDALRRGDAYAVNGGFKRGRVLKLVEHEINFPRADYAERNYELSSLPMVPVATLAQQRMEAKFVIPKPEPQVARASIDVLFKIK